MYLSLDNEPGVWVGRKEDNTSLPNFEAFVCSKYLKSPHLIALYKSAAAGNRKIGLKRMTFIFPPWKHR